MKAWRKWSPLCRLRFETHFLDENYCILIQISSKSFLKNPMSNHNQQWFGLKQGPSYWLDYWPRSRSVTPYGVTRPQCVKWSPAVGCCFELNTSRPRKNDRYFADEIFKCIFVNEIFLISNESSFRYVLLGLIDNNPALVQIMAWRRADDKLLFEPMMAYFTETCMRPLASISYVRFRT